MRMVSCPQKWVDHSRKCPSQQAYRGVSSTYQPFNHQTIGGFMFWTNEQINDYYDSHPNLLLSQLSAITGKSIKELKIILMGE